MFSPAGQQLERGWPGRIDGDRVVQLAAQTLEAFFTGGGTAREHAVYALADVELRPPVLRPPSIRVFDSAGGFAFANTASIHGPGAEIPYPIGVSHLDFGLRVAAMVGGMGAVAGFTIVNDWTARDLEGAKATDFATSIGPVVVTADELGGTAVGRVNGEETARSDLRHPWAQLLETAARNTVLRPGDLLAAPALHGGAALEPGDLVELDVEGIGVLASRVGPRP